MECLSSSDLCVKLKSVDFTDAVTVLVSKFKSFKFYPTVTIIICNFLKKSDALLVKNTHPCEV